MTDLITTVLECDTRKFRYQSPENNESLVSLLFEKVGEHIRSGDVLRKHDIVYALRVAGELAGHLVDENNVYDKIMICVDDYNSQVGRGERIERINFYELVPNERDLAVKPLSELKIKGTLDLKDRKYHHAKEEN